MLAGESERRDYSGRDDDMAGVVHPRYLRT
jgi:hypothetical protein